MTVLIEKNLKRTFDRAEKTKIHFILCKSIILCDQEVQGSVINRSFHSMSDHSGTVLGSIPYRCSPSNSITLNRKTNEAAAKAEIR